MLLSLSIRTCGWGSAVMEEMHIRISFYLLIPRSYYSTQHGPLSITAAACCPFACLQSTLECRPQPRVTTSLACHSPASLSSPLPLREFDHWGAEQLNSSPVDAAATACLRKPSTWGRTQGVWFFQRTADQSDSFWARQYHLVQGPKQQLFSVRMQGDTDINRTWFYFIVVKRKKKYSMLF